jgi:hypothetical protein
MSVLRAVIVDLWQFVCGELGFRKASSMSSASHARSEVTATAAATEPEATSRAVQSSSAFAPDSSLLLPGSDQAQERTLHSNDFSVENTETHNFTDDISIGGKGYIIFPDTPCYLRPDRGLDTVIGTLPYATSVAIVRQHGEWLQIRADELEGWVEKLAVATATDYVFPRFLPEEQYDADHPETTKLRTYIHDEFSAGMMGVALLSCEYVWYRLVCERCTFTWPLSRPRIAGRWAEILRGSKEVHVGTVPLVGGVMEYVDSAGYAQLFYVATVDPEETLTVTGVMPEPEGMFVERTIPRSEWQYLNARFINKK